MPFFPKNPSAAPDDAQTTIAKARHLWRFCLILPFFYMLVSLFVSRYYFDVENTGFLDLSNRGRIILFSILGTLAALAQLTVAYLHFHFQRKIRLVRLIQPEAARFYWRRTFFLAICADFVSIIGLIGFLISGEWIVLITLCIASYLMYIQAYPKARFLD